MAAALLLLVLATLYLVFHGPSFDENLRRAERAYDSRDYVGARDFLVHALRQQPNSLAARLLMARVAMRAGFHDEAQVQLDICDVLNTFDVEAELVRRMLRAYDGDLAFEAQLWEKVDGGHAQAVSMLEALARGYHKNYLLHRMQRALDRLLELQPDHIDAYLSRGWTYERRFNHLVALEDYERALAVNPRHFDARLSKAHVLVYLAKPTEALPIFRELRGDRPRDPRVLLGMFRSLIKCGLTDEACELDGRLAELFPGELDILTERGRYYLELGQADQAETALRAAIAMSPFDYQAHFSLHQALRHAGKFAEADKLKTRLKDIEFDLNQMGDLSEQLQKTPNDAGVRCAIAKIFLRSGEAQEGLRWLKTVLQIAPRHAETHRTLAEYYESHRQPALADQHRRLAEGASS